MKYSTQRDRLSNIERPLQEILFLNGDMTCSQRGTNELTGNLNEGGS